MLGTDRIEIVFRGKSLLGPHVLVPPPAPDPRPRPCLPHCGGDQTHRVHKRSRTRQVDEVEAEAERRHVNVAVDKSWDDGPAAQVDAPKSGAGVAQVCASPDGRDATVTDGERFSQRRGWLEGVNPTVGEQNAAHSLPGLPCLPRLPCLQTWVSRQSMDGETVETGETGKTGKTTMQCGRRSTRTGTRGRACRQRRSAATSSSP